MKTLTIYLNSFFTGTFKVVIFICSIYISAVFFLASIFEEIMLGKVNEGRKALMMEFMQKLCNLAEPKDADNTRMETRNSLS
jgi:hypothetical protein